MSLHYVISLGLYYANAGMILRLGIYNAEFCKLIFNHRTSPPFCSFSPIVI